jgi:hypothetical protein
MLPDRRAYLLVLTPVGLSAVQLLVRFYSYDMNVAMAVDLICILIVFCWIGRFISRDYLLFLTGLSVFHAAITAGFYEPNPLRFVHHTILYIVFPFLLAQAYSRYSKQDFVRMGVQAALFLALFNLIVVPFELILRGGASNLSQLNFSGRAYEIISILLLATVLSTLGANWGRGLLSVSLLTTALISFSRGAVSITLAVFSATISRQISLIASLRGLIFFTSFLISIFFLLPSTFLDSFSFFWTVRLNFASEASAMSNFSGFLSTSGRDLILPMGFEHISTWPLLGTGVATASYFIQESSLGLFAFSGYHNLTVTILAERGLFLGGLYIALTLFILGRLIVTKNWQAFVYFGGFLLFAHTTGSEFVLHSTHVRNANILFFMYLLYICLTRMRIRCDRNV